MATEFKLPELGEGIESADVAQILVKEGDEIQAEQPVLELETEKAVVELPSPYSGKVTKVHVSEGDTIQIGQTLLTVEESDEGPKEKPRAKTKKGAADRRRADQKSEAPSANNDQAAKQPPVEKPAPVAASAERRSPDTQAGEAEKEPRRKAAAASAPPVATKADGRPAQPPAAGPATRRLAHILAIPLDRLKGTGPRGRITLEDVVRAHDALGAKSFAGAPVPKLPDFRKEGEIDEVPLNKIAQTAIESLSRSWSLIPHVTQQGLADVTEVEALRLQYVERAGEDKPKVTMTAIAVRAVVALLKEFPRFNSSVDVENKRLIHKKYYHIGVAVDTDRGLLVPVIRDADRKDIVDIAAEISDLAGRAKARKLELPEMQWATFTISNQGGIGGIAFTPIVNWPEVAILGMSRAAKQMVVIDDKPQVRLILPLSLSYDHRAVNGAEAARFIVRLGEILSDSHKLLFEA